MADMQVDRTTSGAASRQAQQARAGASGDASQDLWEMMRDAKEQAESTRERFEGLGKGSGRYGDAPIEAYARLARAKNAAQVNAAAGFARRQIARLKAAKRTDPDNAKRIQAAIAQLQKAVQRAGKKKRELSREKLDQDRQKKLVREERVREARRQRQELRRKQAQRSIRESGYIREAEVDNRMQSQIAAVDMELREQARSLASSIQPSAESVARQYAAAGAAAAEASPGGAVDTQA